MMPPEKEPATRRAKEHFSNLTRTGRLPLSGYDGVITITMPRALSIRLATAIGQNSIKNELQAVGRQPDFLSVPARSRCGER